jgi:hypothetical protein
MTTLARPQTLPGDQAAVDLDLRREGGIVLNDGGTDRGDWWTRIAELAGSTVRRNGRGER